MNEREYHYRLKQFDGQIGEIAQDNAAVYRIVKMYALGEIVTREEALSQMVVALARNWGAEHKKLFDLYMNFPPLDFAIPYSREGKSPITPTP